MCDKLSYSKKEANRIVNKLNKRKYRKNNKYEVPRRSYFCSECNTYHLTSDSGELNTKSIKQLTYERKRKFIALMEIQRELDSVHTIR